MVVLAESAVGQNGLGRHEIVRVEPRGRTDLRVRGLLRQATGDDFPGALRDPPSASADVRRSPYPARTPRGALTAVISASSGRGSRKGLAAAVGMLPGWGSRGRFSCQPAGRIRCPRFGRQLSKEERR
jgi:hypothetical protein